MKTDDKYKYKAFISYSHAADGKLAPALQSALHRFTKPWYKLRALRVFRDKTSLAMTPELWPSIEKALSESEYVLLLASPQAAQSRWVQQEVGWWLQHHRAADTLFIVLTEGEVFWDRSAGDFDWTRTTALSPNLQARFKNEPLYVDLRWARSEEKLSLRHSQFRAVILDIAAPLHGKEKDELDGEDVRQHRITKAVAGVAITAVVAFAIAAGWQAYVATQQRQEAEHQRTIAQSNQREAETERDRAERQRKKTVGVIAWVINQTARFDIDRWSFDEETKDLLSGLGPKLSDAGFRGRITIEGHIAVYCVVYDNKEEDKFHIAPDDLPIEKCEFTPSDPAYNLVLGEKRAKQLSELLQSLKLPGIEFSVVSYGKERPFFERDQGIRTAKDWNRMARRYDRLHITLEERSK